VVNKSDIQSIPLLLVIHLKNVTIINKEWIITMAVHMCAEQFCLRATDCGMWAFPKQVRGRHEVEVSDTSTGFQ
jgi:hypothetical protein